MRSRTHSLAVSQSRSLAVSHDSRGRSVRSAGTCPPASVRSVKPFPRHWTAPVSSDRPLPTGPDHPVRPVTSVRVFSNTPFRPTTPLLVYRPSAVRTEIALPPRPAATFRPETASRPARSPLSDLSHPLRHAQAPPPAPSRPASEARSQETGIRNAQNQPRPPISTPHNPPNPKHLTTQCPNRTRPLITPPSL